MDPLRWCAVNGEFMAERSIVERIWAALDEYEARHDAEPTVLRLGRRELKALDEFVRHYSAGPTVANLHGPTPTFESVAIKQVEEETHLSVEGPDWGARGNSIAVPGVCDSTSRGLR